MSLYSRHKIHREEKRFPSLKQGFGFFYFTSWMPENERGFWYRGSHERIAMHYRRYRQVMWSAFAKGMIVQIYNTSPFLIGLLADAKEES